MLVAAAVCPHPPLLVPRVAGRIVADLDECRTACLEVIDALRAAEPDAVVVVGEGTVSREHPPSAVGSLVPYGLEVRLGTGDGDAVLPLSLGIGRWLVDQTSLTASTFVEIAVSAAPPVAVRIGAETASSAARVAMLVMADGSGYPSQTPVGDDGRGEAYDDRWMTAVEGADPKPLLDLDPDDDAPLWVSGRAPLQALAGALTVGEEAGSYWQGRIAWRGAPYGVGYLVASLIR